jgi:Rieske Fe-S protein
MKLIYNRFLMSSIFLLSVFLTSCGDKGQHPIPNVAVSLIINLDLPSFQALNNVGGWAYVNGGSKGIVVYRGFDSFMALDRHSTFDPTAECSIATVDSINFFILNDGCSESQYNIMDGTVTKGPARWGLKSYATSWDGQKSVIITN